MIIWDKPDKLTKSDIMDVYTQYISSYESALLKEYDNYYQQHNSKLIEDVADKKRREVTPANSVPTPYYATVVDTMAGYMFQNVQYEPIDGSEEYGDALNAIFEMNHQDVKDMQTGTYSLAFSSGVELVYSEGEDAEIKYATFNPREWIIIYDTKIEPDVFCGIWMQESLEPEYDLYLDVFYADLWQRFKFNISGGVVVERADDRQLFFDECPVVVYNSEIINTSAGYKQSPFHSSIAYIKALDYLLTSNADEVEKLTDALLLVGKALDPDDIKNMDEIKTIFGLDKEEVLPQFIEKQMSPEFRRYSSELLINEIHKASHVIDWYNPDGMAGQVSAKALLTKLFDMNMFSKRIEQVYRLGIYKRIRLITALMVKQSLPDGIVKVILNRTVPSDFLDKIEAFKNVDFISRQTMWEQLGIDAEEEEKRLTEQKKNAVDMFEMPTREDTTDDTTEDEDVE